MMAFREDSIAESDSANDPISSEAQTDESRNHADIVVKERYPKIVAPIRRGLFSIGLDSVIFNAQCHNRQFKPRTQNSLKNSLAASVGYLELANAGDFAANVWNEVPPPTYAVALMAIGGTVALILPYFAFMDARRSWVNIQVLCEERNRLKAEHRSPLSEDVETAQSPSDLSFEMVLSDVRVRELGSEIVERFGMEILMGFGSLIVGVGTLLAIGGKNPSVYLASNLLSGYIGNSIAAIYGLVNAAWSIFILIRVHSHGLAVARCLPSLNESTVRPRLRLIKTHALINGLTGVIAGAASLVTATRWWGYVVLVPCIISMVLCNYFWRHSIGYDRPIVLQPPTTLVWTDIVEELEYISNARLSLTEGRMSSLSTDTLSNTTAWLEQRSLPSVIEFIVRNDLFEDFCFRLLKDELVASTLFDISDQQPVSISSQELLAADQQQANRILDIANECIQDVGPKRLLSRQKYLIDTLGCALRRLDNHAAVKVTLDKR